MYRLAADRFSSFTGPKAIMEHITPVRINQYILHLTKSKLSPTTIKIYLTSLKVIINYAVKLRYVTYDIDPFVTTQIPNDYIFVFSYYSSPSTIFFTMRH